MSKFDTVLKNTKIGCWKLTVDESDHQCLFGDSIFYDLIGVDDSYSPEDIAIFFHQHIHPDDSELFSKYNEALQQQDVEIVYRYIHPTKGQMIVRCNGTKEDDNTLCGTHQDITNTMRLEQDKLIETHFHEEKNALEENIKSQQDFFSSLLDIQACGLLVYEIPSYRVLYMNKEALQMYNIKSFEAAQKELSKTISKVYYEDPSVVEELKKLRTKNGEVDYACIINKDKPEQIHALAKTKVFDTPNGGRAIATTFLNTSEIKTLQKALDRSQNISQAKTDLLLSMSHDLRTPMNAIIGYAQLIQAHWDEETVSKNYLNKIISSSDFLLSIINNILEMSRIDSGKETLEESPWNVQEILDIIDTFLAHEIEKKNLTILTETDIQHPYVYCDSLKVREIFMNILSNAVKYTPNNGKIVMKSQEIPCEEGYVCFKTSISDTGVGISEAYLPHIFEAFTREKSTSQSGILGTGLGLPIVKSYIDMMHGQIEVDSTEGKGTTFTITLKHRIASPSYFEQKKSENISYDQLAGKHVLLVEDNELNLEIAKTVLEDAKIKVDCAINGQIAIQQFETHPSYYYDWILMDIQMPVMDGLTATNIIRKSKREDAKSIPIIGLSANAFRSDIQKSYSIGMNDYITKPLQIDKVYEVLNKNLKG